MAINPNAPGSIRLVHGMEHAGLSSAMIRGIVTSSRKAAGLYAGDE